MRKLSSSQSLFLTVLVGFLLTLPVALWLRNQAPKPPAEQPPAVDRPDQVPGIKPGESGKAMSLNDLQGGVTDLLKSEDGYLLLCFFSTDCPKCAEEAVVWKQVIAEGPRRNARAFLVAADKDLGVLRKYLAANGLGDMPVLYDPKGGVESHFKIHFLPQYLLFDSTGKVVHREVGYSSALGIEPAQRAQAILGAMSPPKTAQIPAGAQR